MKDFTVGQTVLHPQFGTGHIEFSKDKTVIVRFNHGLEECAIESLKTKLGVIEGIESGQFAPAQQTICRVLAEAIVSVNDNWGVFSKSRIALLPHQLWVCHRVLRQWPAHFLVADDVGLGAQHLRDAGRRLARPVRADEEIVTRRGAGRA